MKLKAPIATAVAISIGLIILLGYFFPGQTMLLGLRQLLLQWAVGLAAVALLVGVVNLVIVHTKKITAEASNPTYSIVLIISLAATFILVLATGPQAPWSVWVFKYLLVPIETSLMAVLAISLGYASTRLLRRRPDAFSIIFAVTALLVLLGTGPLLFSQIPILGDALPALRTWISQVPAAAGARGILLGLALGTIATGLRILMGADRPYGG